METKRVIVPGFYTKGSRSNPRNALLTRTPKGGCSLWEQEGFEPVRLESVSKKKDRWWTDTLKQSVHLKCFKRSPFWKDNQRGECLKKMQKPELAEFFHIQGKKKIILFTAISFQKSFYLSHFFIKKKNKPVKIWSNWRSLKESKKKAQERVFRCGTIALL